MRKETFESHDIRLGEGWMVDEDVRASVGCRAGSGQRSALRGRSSGWRRGYLLDAPEEFAIRFEYLVLGISVSILSTSSDVVCGGWWDPEMCFVLSGYVCNWSITGWSRLGRLASKHLLVNLPTTPQEHAHKSAPDEISRNRIPALCADSSRSLVPNSVVIIQNESSESVSCPVLGADNGITAISQRGVAGRAG